MSNEHVRCGLTYECSQKPESQRPIPVKVNAGKVVQNVNPHDWYSHSKPTPGVIQVKTSTNVVIAQSAAPYSLTVTTNSCNRASLKRCKCSFEFSITSKACCTVFLISAGSASNLSALRMTMRQPG